MHCALTRLEEDTELVNPLVLVVLGETTDGAAAATGAAAEDADDNDPKLLGELIGPD